GRIPGARGCSARGGKCARGHRRGRGRTAAASRGGRAPPRPGAARPRRRPAATATRSCPTTPGRSRTTATYAPPREPGGRPRVYILRAGPPPGNRGPGGRGAWGDGCHSWAFLRGRVGCPRGGNRPSETSRLCSQYTLGDERLGRLA